MLGANLAASTDVNSTSGFYRGGYEDFAGVYGGVFRQHPVPRDRTAIGALSIVDLERHSGARLHALQPHELQRARRRRAMTGSGTLSQLDVHACC